MKFEGALELAKATPTATLCDAWGASPEHVASRKLSAHPMTIQEAGALAEIHGMRLLDILSI